MKQTENLKNFKKLVSDEISPAMKDFIEEKKTLEDDTNTQEWGFENFITSEEDAKIFIDAMIKHPEPNEKLKKAFREYGKQETLEYDLLQHIKFALECKNESQAIRLIEKYGFEKQEQNSDKKYSEEDMREAFKSGEENIIIVDLVNLERKKSFYKWFEQFKNK